MSTPYTHLETLVGRYVETVVAPAVRAAVLEAGDLLVALARQQVAPLVELIESPEVRRFLDQLADAVERSNPPAA